MWTAWVRSQDSHPSPIKPSWTSRRNDRSGSKIQALSYRTTFDALTLGVCRFDGEGRLVLNNRRYGEIYRLASKESRSWARRGQKLRHFALPRGHPQWSPRRIPLWRFRTMRTPRQSHGPEELKDGRLVQVSHQPMLDGGWVETHEEVAGLNAMQMVANERLSLQCLIDWVPAILWIKDAESRFVVANKASATKDWPEPSRKT